VPLDSPLGEAADFHPKKEVILLPGVLGCCLESFEPSDPFRRLESTRSGGGGGFFEGRR